MATYLAKKHLWQARRRGPDGSRKSFYAETPEAAEAKADAWLIAASPVPVYQLAPGSVDQFVAAAVAPLKRAQSKSTRTQWAWAMDSFILPVIGSIDPAELTLGHVHMVMGQLDGRPPDTQIAVRKHLFQLFRLLAREGRIPYNFVEEAPAPPPQRRAPGITIVQARRLYHLAELPAVRAIAALGAFAGLARGEMREQTYGGLQSGYAVVAKSAKGGIQHRRRSVPVPLVVLRTLPRSGDPWDGVGPDWMGDLLAAECERLSLPPTNVHQLRHTFASSLDMIGCPRSVSTRLLGHSPRNVTDGYMTASDEALEVWVERLWRHAKEASRADRSTSVGQVGPPRRAYSKLLA